ncbi:MAG TPA: ImmA/IrrE family metallo-endopeptidase [Candidatus Saccharimonadales bacterium]
MTWLTPGRQKEIDNVIAGIYLATNKKYPEDGLIDIVHSCGIDVVDYNFGTHGSEIMGAIKYPEPAKAVRRPIILVNKYKSDTNKTFTLAHELGHYKLYHATKGIKFRLDYDYSVDHQEIKKEVEANYFAGALLMPKEQVIQLAESTSDLSEVAKYFGVSRKALDVRLAWLRKN